MTQVIKKPLERQKILFKQKNSHRKNYEWVGKNHLKNPIRNRKKTLKIKVNITLKIRDRNFHAAKPLAFSLLLFWRDQNHYSNLTSKIM